MTDLRLREYLSSNYNLTNLPDAHVLSGEDDKSFKKDLLEGFDKICGLKNSFTIPLLHEFSDLLKIARESGHIDTVYPWLWEHQIFQNLLAQDYGLQKIYSRCNTVTNHMIAFALWLGWDSIRVAGFELSYAAALENTGMTHAGYNKEDQPLDLFDDPRERRQILGDLKYLCTLASYRGVKIHNLSHEANRLPESLT